MPTLEKAPNMGNSFTSDEEFNQLYTKEIQYLGNRHWTPLNVAKRACAFLATEPGARILDIGSGSGKFCLSGAFYHPNASFTGVEQRIKLVETADQVKALLDLNNVSFIHGNFTRLNFDKYDHFYFFNSFYENLEGTAKIDNSIAYSGELYNYYNAFLFKKLESLRSGTRLATYHAIGIEVPPCFHMIQSELGNYLQFWIKE